MPPRNLDVPFVDSVFHPTDFSEASDHAFAHALAIALVRQTRLMIYHAGGHPETDWPKFPPVRRTLERWGLLDEGSDRAAVLENLAVSVTKAQGEGSPVKACFEAIARHEPELVVLATEGREGLARWLRPSVAERIARRTQTMTLFVPEKGRGFVGLADGTLSLRRILLPVDETPDPGGAIVRATRAAEVLGEGPVAIEVLRVDATTPPPSLPTGEGWSMTLRSATGDVVDAILAAAEDADLIIMPTDGQDGILDVFRGSHTERIVRAATCPVLAVPS